MGWKILGVFVGVVTDITVTLVLGLIFGIVLGCYLIAHGVRPSDLTTRTDEFTHQTYVLLASAGMGCFGSLIGGFVTGWIARRQRIVCGAIMGGVSALTSIPFWGTEPLWYNLLGVALTLLMAIGGGLAAEALLGRTSPPPSPV